MNTKLPTLREVITSRAASFARVLPSNISASRFVAAVETALVTVPGLNECDRKSVVIACMRCASDGLVPDGRDAVLVVGKSKVDGRWINTAQYWPMSQGLQKIAYRSGLVKRLEPRVVYEGDDFVLEFGTSPSVRHRPSQDRGDIVGAYCVATLKGNEAYIEYMDIEELTAIMRRSKSFNKEQGEPKGPWATDFAEMCRKTILRRALKYVPSESMQMPADMDDEDTSDGELIEGASLPPVQHEMRGGMISSGKPLKSADRPVDDLDAGEVADAEMVGGSPVEPPKPAPPSKAKNGAPSRAEESPEVRQWKIALRTLRDGIMAAADKDAVEAVWTEWDASYDMIPDEVTGKAKELVDARLYSLKNG
jgi:phage RecT family recombinase